MKQFKFLLILTALAATVFATAPAIAKDNPKATPTPQSNSSKSKSPSSAGSSSSQNNSSQGNSGQGNSGQGKSPNNSSSNSQSNSPSTSSNNTQNNSGQQNNNSAKNNPASPSTNKKLNPGLVSPNQANGRADKAVNQSSRTSSACQTTTAKGKAQVQSDPCSDFIVVFRPGFARSESADLLKNSSAQVKRQFSAIFNGALVNGPLSKMQALANNPNVLVVEDDLEVKTTALQSSAPWGLDRVDQKVLPLSTTFDDGNLSGVNSYSYVVDTGIDATNVDFEGRVTPGFTAVLDGQGSADCNGHGTHVAGIIGGARYGVAKKTTLIPVRVLDCSGSGSYSSVISGLDWIAANYKAGDAAVVNMSLGGPVSSTLDGAVKNLIAKGINVVVAAGNSNDDACNYSPSRVTDAITVGATGNTDQRASYSNFGSCLDVFAPGSAITSTWLGASGTNTISGTSMASPHVAGIVARFIATNAGLTPQQVTNSLKKSASTGIVRSAGTNSTDALVFLNIVPDTTVVPSDPTPTFQKVNPRGKVVGKR